MTLAVVAYLLATAVVYAALRWIETKAGSGDATTVTLAPRASDCSHGAGTCVMATPEVRSARGLAPVASQETLDDVLDRRTAEGSAMRFDEHCRPLPAVAADSRNGAAGGPAEASVAPTGVSGAVDGTEPAVAPTPAPPDLARSQPQRYVLMVEVEARHDSSARP